MKKRIQNAVLQKALSILSLLLFISSIAEAEVSEIVIKQKEAVVTIHLYKGEDRIVGGTGFIIDSDGIIATNYHVISDYLEGIANSLYVEMENGAFLITKDLISFDKDNDIALFTVEGKRLPTVKLATAYKSKQGEGIVVIGSPMGLETTVSDGIISGIRDKDRLQITAPISPGSSGSPVFNSKGDVIGVAYSSYVIGQNLNFAIPVSYVTNLLNDYKKPQKKVMPIQRAPLAVLIPETMDKLEKAKSEVKKNPDNAEAHNNLGLCYAKLEKYQEAFESFKQAIKIKLDYAEAHNNLGLCYAELGRYREASESYKLAIKIKPDYAEAYNNLGLCYIKLDKYQEAMESCKQAIKLKPDYVDAHFDLGIVYIKQNDRGAALEEYKILKKFNPELANEFFNLLYGYYL